MWTNSSEFSQAETTDMLGISLFDYNPIGVKDGFLSLPAVNSALAPCTKPVAKDDGGHPDAA
jgi:hypothetical protein